MDNSTIDHAGASVYPIINKRYKMTNTLTTLLEEAEAAKVAFMRSVSDQSISNEEFLSREAASGNAIDALRNELAIMGIDVDRVLGVLG